MKINKNQALYRALPNCWTTYSDSTTSDYKYACEVTAWNTKKVVGINEEMIKNDIIRRVESFSRSGGVVRDELSKDNIQNFTFVEPAMIEGISDIVCKVNPCTFYCPSCGIVSYKPKSKSAPYCSDCKTRMSQLQMVYACDCGFADGVKPYSKEQLYYHSKDKNNQFKFFTLSGAKREMIMPQCPTCNAKNIYPKNATDTRLFYSQSGNLVNLYNKKYAEVLDKYKFDAELLMLAKWFNVLSNDDFLNIMDDPKSFFEHKSKSIDDPEVIAISKRFGLTPEEVVETLDSASSDALSIGKIKDLIDKVVPRSVLGDDLPLITMDLTEFDTLKYPKSKITLEEGIQKGIETHQLVEESEVYELIDKLHIKNMQVSEAVQIVNYAYGYTRLRNCPDGTDATNNLRLRGFNNRVFTTILDTEGILVELDMFKIFNWLVENDIVSNDIEITNEEEAKKWFLTNIHLDSITHFSTISGVGGNKVTKVVYSLLHSISHLMIISAGKHSGLSRDSISEIIFPDTASFFIYPTSSEGVTLGSISGMFETALNLFLQDTLKDNEICTFDPICSTTQNGACVACIYLSEVNCCHFNKDLSRAYLYGGNIAINDEYIDIKKGFWK